MAARRVPSAYSGPQVRITGLSGELLGRRYEIDGTLTIGRGGESNVVLTDPRISREHARLSKRADGQVELEDLNSRNGTTVNGSRVRRAVLKLGDRFGVGGATFLFGQSDNLGQELVARNRMATVGQLAVGLAHDLNNALCVVQATASVLKSGAMLTQAERDECIADILSGSTHAAELAKRMLSYARGQDARAADVDVRHTIQESVHLLKRALPRTITIRADIVEGARLVVFVDPSQLHQVLFNLALNARDAIEEAGRPGSIVVAAKSVGEDVEISVTDDGCGMTEEVRSRAFEPFFSSKAGGRGHGVGLATVAEIVKSHGGQVDLKSVRGLGTTFVIRLPALGAKDRRRNTTRSAFRLETRAGDGRLAVVVEGQPGVRNAVVRALRHAGYAVEAFEDADGALEKLHGRAPSVVLLDFDNITTATANVVREVRATNRDVAIVGLSATGGEAIAAEARTLGAPALLLKPFSHDELLETVAIAALPSDLADDETTIGTGRDR